MNVKSWFYFYSMEKHKDFLHQTWFGKFSRDRLDYFPFGDTQATDLLYNLDLGQNIDVLLLGTGKIFFYIQI